MFLVFIAGTVAAQDKDIPAQIDQHTFDPSTLIWLKAPAVK